MRKHGGLGSKNPRKMIVETNQNAVQDVTTPLTKRFITRQEMLQRQRFWGTIYTDTTIDGVKYAPGNRVAQVYVT